MRQLEQQQQSVCKFSAFIAATHRALLCSCLSDSGPCSKLSRPPTACCCILGQLRMSVVANKLMCILITSRVASQYCANASPLVFNFGHIHTGAAEAAPSDTAEKGWWMRWRGRSGRICRRFRAAILSTHSEFRQRKLERSLPLSTEHTRAAIIQSVRI